jgi:hypothetical protein
MLKKSLLSLAIAAGMGLAGCSGTDGTGDVGPNGGNPNQGGVDQATLDLIQDPGTYPLYDPASSVVPVPSDLQFSGTTDGTLVYSGETDNAFQFIDPTTGATGADFNPVTNAIADMDGASVLAQIDLPFSGGIDETTVVANQTVFLVPLADCRDDNGNDLDPVTGCLANGNLSHIDTANPANMFGTTPNFRAEVITNTGGTENAVLRITPLEPLQGATRYLVFMTNGIQDTAGDAVKPSLAYNDLGSESYLPVPQLQSVRALIQGYEQLASGYVAATIGNDLLNFPALSENTTAILTSYGINPLDPIYVDSTNENYVGVPAIAAAAAAAVPDSVVLSYSFTTGGTNEVLSVNTAPGLANPALKTAIDASAAVASTFNVPQARTVNITKTEDLLFADVYVGTIDLPYYLTAPSFYQDLAKAADATEQLTAANVIAAKWTANDQIDDLGAVPGLEALSSVTPPTDKVTRHFPFAKASSTLQAPIAVFVPKTGTDATTKTVIYQHGYTVNRTAATAFAKEMTAQGHVVIAADLPLHGLEIADFVEIVGTTALISGTSTGAKFSPLDFATVDQTAKVIVTAQGAGVDATIVGAALAAVGAGSTDATHLALYNAFVSVSTSVATFDGTIRAGGTPNEADTAVYTGYMTAVLGQYMVNENHFGLTTDDGRTPRAISAADIADGDDESGSLYIYPLHFQITRDNIRQSVMNLLNVGASIGNIATEAGITLNTTGLTPTGSPASLINFVGHSFGAIVGAGYASVNNTVGYLNVNNNAIMQGAIAQLNTGNTDLNTTFQSALLNALGTDNITCGQASTFVSGTLQPIEDASTNTQAPIPAGTVTAIAGSSAIQSLNALGCGNGNLPHLQTVTLANGTGAVVKALEHSQTFSGPVLQGLAAQGITQSSSDYETFTRIFQAIMDSSDPLALAGGYSSPLVTNTTGVLTLTVENDALVPNSADAAANYIYAKAPVQNALGQTGLAAPLVGTEALNTAMGVTNIRAGQAGNGTAPQQVAVRFVDSVDSTHYSFGMASLLDEVGKNDNPTENEMSAMTQSILASFGTIVGVGTQAPAAIENTIEP